MPNIRTISDLRNYNEILHDEAVYEKTQTTIRLMNELVKGRKSGEEKSWLTLEAVEEKLGLSHK